VTVQLLRGFRNPGLAFVCLGIFFRCVIFLRSAPRLVELTYSFGKRRETNLLLGGKTTNQRFGMVLRCSLYGPSYTAERVDPSPGGSLLGVVFLFFFFFFFFFLVLSRNCWCLCGFFCLFFGLFFFFCETRTQLFPFPPPYFPQMRLTRVLR